MVAERGGRSRRRAIGTLPSLMGVVPAFLLLFLLTRHVVGHETRRTNGTHPTSSTSPTVILAKNMSWSPSLELSSSPMPHTVSSISAIRVRNRTNPAATNVTYLLNNLLDKYDNSLRPDIGGPALKVLVNMQVRSMGPISETDMSYSIDCYFRQTWIDKRLNFSSDDRKQLALSVQMLQKIWKPDTYIFNGRKSYLHTITTPNKFVRLFSEGRVFYSQRLTIRASCNMDLSDFPMDQQRCPLTIGSFGYSLDDVVFAWTGHGVNTDRDMKLSQFDLIRTPTGNGTKNQNKKIHSTLLVNFHLQRHMGNFVIQVYGPCILLVVISWVSFWLNREATSDRISLGVTTVLTMTFLGLEARTDLPQVAYPTALDYFVFLSFMFIFSTVVQFGLVHYFTKIGAGEYYLEELEETVCEVEIRKRKLLERKVRRDMGVSENDDYDSCSDYDDDCDKNEDENDEYDRNMMSSGDDISYIVSGSGSNHIGASNPVFGRAVGVAGCGEGRGVTFNASSSPDIKLSSTAAVYASGEDYLEQTFLRHNHYHTTPNFYNSTQTLPLLPKNAATMTMNHVNCATPANAAAAASSSSERNILNHHPYGTFYYNKKTGKSGRHKKASNSAAATAATILHSKSNSASILYFKKHNGGVVNRHPAGFSSSSGNKRVRNGVGGGGGTGGTGNGSSGGGVEEELDQLTKEAMAECGCKRCITREMNNPTKSLNSVSKIDRISRVVFPLSFSLINAFYWYTYLKHSERIDLGTFTES